MLLKGTFWDSKILYLQQEVDTEPEVLLLPTDDYPSEQPYLLRECSGTVHFLLGDHRQDSDFEEWTIDRSQILEFSTTIISFTLEEPAEIELTVYDISGRQILQKILGSRQAGLHSE